ncbi:MAG: DUF4340 domain-containing protein [Zetaproteobacteria bacterium]|nr:DUF4340 domain-containing protein [Zetaproteobacteria bacterium]
MQSTQNKIGLMIGFLVAQLALALYLYSKNDPMAVFTPNEPMLTFVADKVSKITIQSKSEDAEETIEMVKGDQGWSIPDFHQVPVANSKIETLLTTVGGFRKSYPVGKTELAAKQFSVTEDSYERKITLHAGEQNLGTLYLGKSPSFKKVYAKTPGDSSNTYAVNFNNYEAPLKKSEWIDKALLKLEMSAISKLTLRDLEIEQKDGNFTLAGLSDQEESNTTKVSSLAQAMLSPTYDDILGPSAEVATGAQRVSFLATLSDGKVREYTYHLPAQSNPEKGQEEDKEEEAKPDHYVLKVSDQGFAFKVPAYGIDKFTSAKRAELVQAKSAPTDSSSPSTETPKIGDEQGALQPEMSTKDISDAQTTGAVSYP